MKVIWVKFGHDNSPLSLACKGLENNKKGSFFKFNSLNYSIKHTNLQILIYRTFYCT